MSYTPLTVLQHPRKDCVDFFYFEHILAPLTVVPNSHQSKRAPLRRSSNMPFSNLQPISIYISCLGIQLILHTVWNIAAVSGQWHAYKCLEAMVFQVALQWRHNEHPGVSNHQRLVCLFSRLFRLTSKKTWKSALLAPCEGNPLVTIGPPPPPPLQRASKAETVSILWRHGKSFLYGLCIVINSQKQVISSEVRCLSWLRNIILLWHRIKHAE